MRTRTLGKLLAWALLSAVLISVTVWYGTLDTLPNTFRIATARDAGVYQNFAGALADLIQQRTGHPVSREATAGSLENRERLLSNDADLALLQHGSVALDGLAIVAPLFPEVVHVVVRTGQGMNSIHDLAGRRTVLGPAGSGMRMSAHEILSHYGVETADAGEDVAFEDLMDDESLDAAIVTTGIQNVNIRALLATGQFELLPILGARALALKLAHFRYFELPRGLYSEGPAVPPEAIPTVATVALLAVRKDASALLVEEALGALYEEDLQSHFPTLIPLRDAREWSPRPLHPSARSHFDPFDRVGWLANVMESLAALKELLFALGAAVFLLSQRWRRLKKREHEQELGALKERLDTFLNRTVRIERAQMQMEDPEQLKECLDEVTRIKLEALSELTDEDLRGDRMFSIFLAQCAGLVTKIQAKIAMSGSSTNAGPRS